jgi:hypothetical protein
VLGGFVWDDLSLIVEERLVTGPHRLMDHFSRLFWSGPLNAHEGFYRPLISLSYAADYRLWNGQPAGFHLTNLALHLACTSLVWALCRRASPDAHPAVLAALAMGFGLMPRLTESVAWISGRTDLAAGVGALSTFLLYRPGPGAWGRKVAASLMLLAGLLCKEVAIAGLVAVLILELRHRKATGDRLSNVLGHLAPAMAAMVVYGLLRAHAGAVDTTAIERDPGWHTRGKVAATFLEAIGRYPLMMIDVFRPRLLIGTVGRPSLPIVALGAALVVLLVWGWCGSSARQHRRG